MTAVRVASVPFTGLKGRRSEKKKKKKTKTVTILLNKELLFLIFLNENMHSCLRREMVISELISLKHFLRV